MEDAIELADIYYKEGFTEVEAKAGMHFGTYKVYVNFIQERVVQATARLLNVGTCIYSGMQARLSPRDSWKAALRARRRHTVSLARRHMVEMPLQTNVVGGFSGVDRWPQGQGI